MHPTAVALFPGQGSQHVGMGKELYENFSVAREVFEEASDATHINIKSLCFSGPDSDLILTENTQPCLLTVSVAAFRVVSHEVGFSPTLVAGHSLGEYSALVAAGALRLDCAARWVHERGLAMQKAVPAGEGTMAAILGLEDASISLLCKLATQHAREQRIQNPSSISVPPTVAPANFNAPGQVVIAGSADAILSAIALLKEGTTPELKGGKAIPLSVSAPFHSPLMEPARSRMATLFQESAHRPGALICPYVPNATARITQESGVIFDLLVEQVDHPVLWRASIEAILKQGHTQFIEFGPGKVLTGLLKRIGSSIGAVSSCVQVNDVATVKGVLT